MDPFQCPSVVSEELWQKANLALSQRGRGRGKQGKSIQALLRNRLFCPRCGKPMVVRRDGDEDRVYYHCSRHYRPWDTDACSYRKFVPGAWEESIWDFVIALLTDNSWIEQQLIVEENRSEASLKVLEGEAKKLDQIRVKIIRVQEGYEAGLYNLEEAKTRIVNYQNAALKAKEEMDRFRQTVNKPFALKDIDALRKDLKALAESNLEKATFEEKREIIDKLNIKIYPTEDLKTMRIKSGINVAGNIGTGGGSQFVQCGKIILAPAKGIRTTFSNWILVNKRGVKS